MGSGMKTFSVCFINLLVEVETSETVGDIILVFSAFSPHSHLLSNMFRQLLTIMNNLLNEVTSAA